MSPSLQVLRIMLLVTCCPWSVSTNNTQHAGVGISMNSFHHLALDLGAPPLRRVYQTAGDVPIQFLSQGIAHLGQSFRTQRFIDKLRSREAVTLLVLGGSVTNRHAGCTDSLINCEDPNGCCGLVEVSDPEAHLGNDTHVSSGGWARLFVDFMQQTWPPRNGGRHKLFNAGFVMAGNSPEPFLNCWLPRLPRQLDLILVETHVQDSYIRPSQSDPVLEALLRRLLRWDGGFPVVMLTPGFNWCQQPSWFDEASFPDILHMVCRATSDGQRTPVSVFTPFPKGGHGSGGGGYEDEALLLAQYYNIPATSIRNAMFTWLQSNMTDGWPLSEISEDGPHPSPPMQRVMGDLLIHWLRVLVILHEWFKIGTEPMPMPPVVSELKYITHHCIMAISSGQCEFERLGVPVPAEGGFQWMDDTPNQSGKWGWVSKLKNSTLRLRVNTTLPQIYEHGGDAGGRFAFVGVEVLRSYSGMGEAAITCEGGCICERMVVSCVSGAFSLPYTAHVQISQADDCVVVVGVASDEGKVKVTGITVGETPEMIVPEHLSSAHRDFADMEPQQLA